MGTAIKLSEHGCWAGGVGFATGEWYGGVLSVLGAFGSLSDGWPCFGNMDVDSAFVPLEDARAFPVFGGSGDATGFTWEEGPLPAGTDELSSPYSVGPSA